MTTMTTNIHGDVLEIIRQDSGMWMAPATGQQHIDPAKAMRMEIEHYMVECGESLSDPSIIDDIDTYIAEMA